MVFSNLNIKVDLKYQDLRLTIIHCTFASISLRKRENVAKF